MKPTEFIVKDETHTHKCWDNRKGDISKTILEAEKQMSKK